MHGIPTSKPAPEISLEKGGGNAGRAVLFGLVFLVLAGIAASWTRANELSGHMAVESMLFFKSPALPEQGGNSASIAFEPEYYHGWQNDSSLTFVPFARLDSNDAERSHFDIRELLYSYPRENWGLQVGVGKVFWGVTEFVHLVDIINQTDAVESLDNEEKLGQPMVNLSLYRDWGYLGIYLLPYFRERTFPGRSGRLRTDPRVDTSATRYESSAAKRHLDAAIRYSKTIGDMDVGVYHFKGTGREPLLLEEERHGEHVLVPFYEQLDQTGTDIQLVAGRWLLKFEGFYRHGRDEDFWACTGGFEYTFTGIAETYMDLGLIGEWVYDDRRAEATTSFENDLIFGLRLAVNNPSSLEFIVGMIQDIDSSSRIGTFEANFRLGDNMKATVEMGFFDLAADDYSFSFADDDYLSFELAYYF